MERLEAATVVHVPQATAFEFLLDFPGYAAYSEYLESVDPLGDGAEGTVYELTVAWRVLSYTIRSEVTDVSPPSQIDWRVLGSFDARGAWIVEPIEEDSTTGATPVDGADVRSEPSSLVRFRVDYDPGSAADVDVSLPGPLSLDPLLDRLEPIVQREAERTVERVVADLEGSARPVDLRVRTGDGVGGSDEGN